MLSETMIPANSAFHSLHQAINGTPIEQAEASNDIKQELEAAKPFLKEPPKDNAKSTLKGFGLGSR